MSPGECWIDRKDKQREEAILLEKKKLFYYGFAIYYGFAKL